MSINTLDNNPKCMDAIADAIGGIISANQGGVNNVVNTTLTNLSCTDLVAGSQTFTWSNETQRTKGLINLVGVLQDSSGTNAGNFATTITLNLSLNGSLATSYALTTGTAQANNPFQVNLSTVVDNLLPSANNIITVALPVTSGGTTPNLYNFYGSFITVDSFPL